MKRTTADENNTTTPGAHKMTRWKSKATTRAAVIGLAATLMSVTQIGSASADFWSAEKVRIRAATGQSECLTAYERSTDPMVLERCDTDNLRGNWRIIPWNPYDRFMVKNWASGECLDAGAGIRALVYTSPCDRNDSGQVWAFDCNDGGLRSEGPTTHLTWWNDNTVSMRPFLDVPRIKQTWEIVPRPAQC
ncbi:hypothetical protein HUT19_39550 [Streptomyces sp. NA02950]|uniref:hypothetical protein n=1 Tax=Streptomyces sp. NA02950 TaxID=2742137 RepID=UPI001592450E|nr:hypothetical protein [Streptomyces sp. NA02950]QKV97039.1 hypothetical protein HUT19_39550 [Streptomyces sp. NA02950]